MVPLQSFLGELFIDGLTTYAILDGAQLPDLPQRLHTSGLEYICLYRGQIPDDLAQVAPYLVMLKRDDNFTKFILEQGWGKAWGIYARAEATIGLQGIRRHFRTFLMVERPGGGPMYFRYYDPRIMRVYLPTCNRDEQRIVFGPLDSYVIEDDAPDRLMRFYTRQTHVIVESVSIR